MWFYCIFVMLLAALPAKIWWRRGELNPRPQALRPKVYMHIPHF